MTITSPRRFGSCWVRTDPGTNTILITHKPNIIDALGKDWLDSTGEASLFRPENGSYRFIARVRREDWPVLAAAAK